MALEIEPRPAEEFHHVCPLPWPIDPEMPEGHLCECGRHWVYQPAHWGPLLTLDELRMRQEAGDFLRGLIPTFAQQSMLPGARVEETERPPAVIVPIRPSHPAVMPPPESTA